MTAIPDHLHDVIRSTVFRRGDFHLPDGTVLDEYFDEYLMAADPNLLRKVASAMTALLPPDTEVIAGIELGGVALAVAISAVTGLSAAFVRRRRKAYGTRRQVEGAGVAGRAVVLVDDVARTGTQLAGAAAALSGESARVLAALCVVDRALGAGPRLVRSDVPLRALLTVSA